MHTRSFVAAAALAASALVLPACQTGQEQGRTSARGTSRQLVGSWVNNAQSRPGEFNFASVTFAPDGTYTSKASYAVPQRGEQTVAQTGSYTVQGDQLVLTGAAEQGQEPERRTYQVNFLEDGQLEIVSRNPPATVRMNRYSGS